MQEFDDTQEGLMQEHRHQQCLYRRNHHVQTGLISVKNNIFYWCEQTLSKDLLWQRAGHYQEQEYGYLPTTCWISSLGDSLVKAIMPNMHQYFKLAAEFNVKP